MRQLNLRLVGLPGNTEKGDLIPYLNEWLPKLLGTENLQIPPSVDQAFRLPKAATSNAKKPNLKPVPLAILVKFRWLINRDRAMKAARKNKCLQFEENRVMFSPDLSVEVQQHVTYVIMGWLATHNKVHNFFFLYLVMSATRIC